MITQLLLSLFSLLWCPQVRIPGPGGGHSVASAITFINANSGGPGSLGTFSVPLSVTAGNLIVVAASQYYGGVTFTISDTLNTYTQVVAYTPGSGLATTAWWAKAATTATPTISVTGAPTSLPNIVALQFAGQNPTTPLVGNGVGNSGTTPVTTGTFTAGASAGNLIVAFGASSTTSATFSAGSPAGMTIPTGAAASSNGSVSAEYVVVSSTQTTASIAFSSGTNQNIVAVVIQ